MIIEIYFQTLREALCFIQTTVVLTCAVNSEFV